MDDLSKEADVVSEAQLVVSSPSEALLSKLDEPRVAQALSSLLEHADLLAILVIGLDGLLQRGDTISDSIAKAVGELRGVAAGQAADLGPIDLPGLARSLRTLSTLSAAMSDAAPGLESLLRSDLADPRAIDVIGMAARSLINGAESAAAEPLRLNGVLPLLRVLKDDDVARGLGFLVQVARALGRELKDA